MEENILGQNENPQSEDNNIEERRGPGRPPSAAKMAAKDKVNRVLGNQEDPRQERPTERQAPRRKERIPFGVPTKHFNAPQNDGYVYRVFNDNWRKEPGRIQRALDAGYEYVKDDQSGTVVGTNEDGSAINGVLMRIPKEFYEEDQKLKQKEIDKVDAEINRGKFQEKPGDKRYIPSSGINIEAKLKP